jgi:Domain of unknown function (DUF4371)
MNHLWLKASIASVKWFTFQICAFRGNDEAPISKYQGNFLQMIKIFTEFNPKVENIMFENATYYFKYTSHDIQKETLNIFASKGWKHIRDEIRDLNFSIIMDESCDVAKRAQMALVFRFIDHDGVLKEYFSTWSMYKVLKHWYWKKNYALYSPFTLLMSISFMIKDKIVLLTWGESWMTCRLSSLRIIMCIVYDLH